ncbi:MAG: hypothetical protein KC910_01515 [Candidatus Eremiobacteraeota bacterium]|nr:hypothetical protein [Candidatus Eremiobacteraeota bacterium]
MRWIVGLLWLALWSPVGAEVRLVNATGRPLKVDVLHQQGQFRDVELPAGRSISEPIGSRLDPDDSEMVVIKTADGQELLREKLATDRVYVIENYASRVTIGYTDRYRGETVQSSYPHVLNLTGQQLTFKIEYADFSVYEGTGKGLDKPNDAPFDQLGRSIYRGDKMNVTITLPGFEPVSSEMVAGGFYVLEAREGQLVLTRLN